MQPGAMRFEELVKLETPFQEGLLLIKDLIRQTFDQQIVASLEDVHRGTVLVEGQVTHRGCKLPGWASPDRARTDVSGLEYFGVEHLAYELLVQLPAQ